MSTVKSFIFVCVLSIIGLRNSHGLKEVCLQSDLIFTTYTPFDKYEKLNLSVVPEIAQYYKEHNVTVVYISAYYGGGPSLSLDERKALVKTWAELSDFYGFDLLVEIGAASFVEILEYAAYCSQLNVTALTAFSEVVYQPENPSELLEDLERICSAAPNLPLFSHELSVVDQEIDPVQTYLSACDKVSCFAGIIASVNYLLTIRASTPNTSCQFFTDTNEQVFPGLILQTDAAASPALALCPGLAFDAADAVAAGNVSRALDLQQKLNDVVAAICDVNGGPIDDTSRTYFENLKTGFYLISGIDTGVRYPLEKPNATEYEKIRSNLANLNCY